MEKLKSLVKAYETWVSANPETVNDVESVTKWVSYFIAGRISDSTVVSELIYSLSNILVLYNDRIIERRGAKTLAAGRRSRNESSLCYRLKVMLTTLEYCEVLIEITAKRTFGVRGKWVFVTLLQVAKATARFFILKHSTDNIITTPAMPSLNRKEFVKHQKDSAIAATNGNAVDEPTASARFTFQLKRSGRMVRKVEGAPPLQYRDFKLLQEIRDCDGKNTRLSRALLHAEYLYIAKPLLHLASMGIFGQKHWNQYVVALTVDLISIRLYYKNRHLMNKQQKLEMSRRCVNLLLYLMRSPFYERYTQTRLERVLGTVARNIPFLKIIANPLIEYIPYWQSTYLYLWAT